MENRSGVFLFLLGISCLLIIIHDSHFKHYIV